MRIRLEHGAGGELMEELIREVILKNLTLNSAGGIGLEELDDGATIPLGDKHLVFTIDGHTVKPIFFPGGDIGRLAVSGTVNDLAVMGAQPLAIASSLIIEEGFEVSELEKILKSMDETAKEVPVPIVTGDTKVVEDRIGIFVITAGVGVAERPISDAGAKVGDVVLVSGTIGDHGIALMSHREGISFETELKSDVAPIWDVVKAVADAIGWENIHAMKDPTRGGLSNALNEMARKANVGILVREEAIPIRPEVKAASEMLGISPYEVANEGKVVMIVAKEYAEEALEAMKKTEKGRDAAIIGEVIGEYRGKVILETGIGGRRFLEPPLGDPVPRVC
ncbi:hydrogenase expression/formation protein HypE [Pyrococcus furiosus DSM 3638]|uniref:Hydrogenase expression/formation protein HypE n=3 Tax=Pyrococcus furiosus TaxID=2261 RepID=A0A5C0XU79_PYRFU|nr:MULTISPECIES: hydrogenase expression/formation protein HypE [Pyrococcus]AFN03397.1 hydrogenase expression/formation protein HypE [Pyrococcus furiosus COM1]MDK2869640.1 hydrogenase expression/formation protein HypE [Pyrococcus sp.]QEK78310.1 hydrogenase expression/formation protein HypE [Pyrococcus furiosus DSM 3638]